MKVEKEEERGGKKTIKRETKQKWRVEGNKIKMQQMRTGGYDKMLF